MERINNVKNKVVSSASKGKNIIKKAQKVNLQQVKVKDENGNVIKVRLSAREIRALKNAA